MHTSYMEVLVAYLPREDMLHRADSARDVGQAFMLAADLFVAEVLKVEGLQMTSLTPRDHRLLNLAATETKQAERVGRRTPKAEGC